MIPNGAVKREPDVPCCKHMPIISIVSHHKRAQCGWQRTPMRVIELMEKDIGEQCYSLEAPVTDVGVCWGLPSPVIDF